MLDHTAAYVDNISNRALHSRLARCNRQDEDVPKQNNWARLKNLKKV